MARRHQFRNRPEAGAEALDQGVAQGKCYLVDQSQLVFGSDRATPVPWRPTVSLARNGARLMVLPSTTQTNDRFFRLESDACLTKRRRPEAEKRASYLSPRFETVPVAHAREVGILDQSLRVRIAEWINSHWGGA